MRGKGQVVGLEGSPGGRWMETSTARKPRGGREIGIRKIQNRRTTLVWWSKFFEIESPRSLPLYCGAVCLPSINIIEPHVQRPRRVSTAGSVVVTSILGACDWSISSRILPSVCVAPTLHAYDKRSGSTNRLGGIHITPPHPHQVGIGTGFGTRSTRWKKSLFSDDRKTAFAHHIIFVQCNLTVP